MMKWSHGNNTQQAANLEHSLPLKKEVQSFQIFFFGNKVFIASRVTTYSLKNRLLVGTNKKFEQTRKLNFQIRRQEVH